MNASEKALAAAQEAIAAAEVAQRAGDKPRSLASTPEGLFMLTEAGRLYLRTTDPSHYNDGRTRIKFMWVEVEGPLG